MRPETSDQAEPSSEWIVDEKAAAEAILAGIPKQFHGDLARRVKLAPKSYAAAVFLKCMDCCAWNRKEVQLCRVIACSLYPHRTRLFKPRGDASSARTPREDRPDLAETA